MPVHLVMPPAPAGGDPQADWVEVPAQARELLRVLFPHLSGLEVSRVADTGDAVVAFASVAGAQARCPQCGQASSRVHGRYQRLLADGAAGGRPLLIALSVRRFRCTASPCPRITFVEQAEGLTGRHLRRALPLREVLARFGLELAGRRVPGWPPPWASRALLHAAAAGHRAARSRGDSRAAGHRGRRLRAAQGPGLRNPPHCR